MKNLKLGVLFAAALAISPAFAQDANQEGVVESNGVSVDSIEVSLGPSRLLGEAQGEFLGREGSLLLGIGESKIQSRLRSSNIQDLFPEDGPYSEYSVTINGQEQDKSIFKQYSETSVIFDHEDGETRRATGIGALSTPDRIPFTNITPGVAVAPASRELLPGVCANNIFAGMGVGAGAMISRNNELGDLSARVALITQMRFQGEVTVDLSEVETQNDFLARARDAAAKVVDEVNLRADKELIGDMGIGSGDFQGQSEVNFRLIRDLGNGKVKLAYEYSRASLPTLGADPIQVRSHGIAAEGLEFRGRSVATSVFYDTRANGFGFKVNIR